VLAEEVLPLVFIENGHGSEIFDGVKDLFVVHGHGIGLVDHQVIRLPPLSECIVRLVEQCEDIFLLQHSIQDLFRNVDLVDHHVVVVGVLGGNDDAQLIDQRDLGGAHGFHRVAIQRTGLISQEDICQTAVHAVIGVRQRRIFYLVD